MNKDQVVDTLEGYFRYTLRLDLDIDIPAAADDIVAMADRELEVLTQERDNALLRIEELEQEREGWSWSAVRGGVNPNA